MKNFLIIVFCFVLCPVLAKAATYYVDESGGSDAAAGTSEGTAWQSTDKVNDYAEATGFSDGDVIAFKRGETWGTGYETVGDDGSAINWGTINGLRFTAYGSGNLPRLNSNEMVPFHITAPNVDNLVIEYFDVSGMDALSGDTAIRVDGESSSQTDGMQSVTIRFITYNGFTGASTYPRPQAAIRIDDVGGDITVNDCDISNLLKGNWADTVADTGSWQNTDSIGILIKYDDTGDQTVAKTQGTVTLYNNTYKDIWADGVHANNIRTTTSVYDNVCESFGENCYDLKGPDGWTFTRETMSDPDGYAGQGGSGDDGSFFVIHDSDVNGYYDAANITVTKSKGTDHQRGVFKLLNNASNITFQFNYWRVAQYGEINPANNVTLESEVVHINQGSEDETAVLRVYSNAANDDITIQNILFYVSATSHTDIIRWDDVSGHSNGVVRNNIFWVADTDAVDLIDMDNNYVTVTYNAYYNSGNNDRIRYNGISYDLNDQATWRSAGHTGGLLFATGDPGLNNPGAGQFWPTTDSDVYGAGDSLNKAANLLSANQVLGDWPNPSTTTNISDNMGPFEVPVAGSSAGNISAGGTGSIGSGGTGSMTAQ